MLSLCYTGPKILNNEMFQLLQLSCTFTEQTSEHLKCTSILTEECKTSMFCEHIYTE